MIQKTLILLGSPRKKGNSATLAERVKDGVTAAGGEVETVYLNSLKIRPCQGCEKCQQEDSIRCVIDDDMQSLYPKINDASALVIASPIYWFNFSAQTKAFFDRCYAVWVGGNRKAFAGRRFALVLTFEDTDPFSSGAVNAMRSFQDICKYLGARIEGMIYGSAGKAGEIKSNRALMQKAYSLGEQLAAPSDSTLHHRN
jgi:multimeric flavodoxin WrbA